MENTELDCFSNQQVTFPSPSIELLEFTKLSAKYAQTRRLTSLSLTLIYALIVLFTLHQPWIKVSETFINILTASCIIVSVLGLLITLHRNFADPKKAYSIREQDISYRSGLIFNKIVSQPILRIQHVELKRGPIDRKVGLAKLQVFSAGGALHTFEIPGLPLADAEQLRQFILSHKDLNLHG